MAKTYVLRTWLLTGQFLPRYQRHRILRSRLQIQVRRKVAPEPKIQPASGVSGHAGLTFQNVPVFLNLPDFSPFASNLKNVDLLMPVFFDSSKIIVVVMPPESLII